MSFQRISVAQAKQLLAEKPATLLDIRDGQSFTNGHIEQAQHIEAVDVPAMLNEHPKDQAIIIYCYHGNSSQQAASYFAANGFSEVYSVDGGYEAWRIS